MSNIINTYHTCMIYQRYKLNLFITNYLVLYKDNFNKKLYDVYHIDNILSHLYNFLFIKFT